jgi:hypothetical protein
MACCASRFLPLGVAGVDVTIYHPGREMGARGRERERLHLGPPNASLVPSRPSKAFSRHGAWPRAGSEPVAERERFTSFKRIYSENRIGQTAPDSQI